jgi:hypothetical protein
MPHGDEAQLTGLVVIYGGAVARLILRYAGKLQDAVRIRLGCRGLPRKPSLNTYYGPKRILPVLASLDMCLPACPNQLRLEYAISG